MDDNELIQWYKDVFDEYPSVGLLAFIREVRRLDATALEQAAPAWEPVPDDPGWNPVGESLPENIAWVLVYADGAINCMGYTPGKGFEDWTLQQAPNIVIQEITHWRHLPAGPIAQRRPATAAGEEE